MVLLTTAFKKLQRVALKLIAHALPAHSKRLVLWSTIYGINCANRGIDTNGVSELNRLLTLAKNEEAACLPLRLCSVIIDDVKKCTTAVADAVQGKNIAECADRFVTSVPTWLKYASDQMLRDDFTKLMRYHPPAVKQTVSLA